MDRLSDIGMAIVTMAEIILTLLACLLIMVIPAVTVITTVLLLIKLLGPVMGFLTALTLSIAMGVIIQDIT